MNLREARQDLLADIMAGNSVLFQSSSGIGKSEMIMQVFDHLKAEGAKKGETWGHSILFLATQQPTDLVGVPWRGERRFIGKDGKEKVVNITDPALPLWNVSHPHGDDPGGRPSWDYDKFFLFLDEYGQGEPDTKRGAAELFLNGGVAPYYLPPGSPVVGATNVGARYGVTKDFDFCITRRSLKVIHGSADIWLDDFAAKPYKHKGKMWSVMPYTKAWVKGHPDILFEQEPAEQGPFCNPRTLTSADRYVQVRADMNGGVVPVDDFRMIESITGKMGRPATESYVGGMKFMLELPSYEDVVRDPTGTPVPKRPDLMMLMAYEMAHRCQYDHVGDVLTFIQRMAAVAKDFEVTFITSLLRRDFVRLVEHPALDKWVSRNSALVATIAAA